MNLVDIRQVVTQILGFLLMVWILRRYAWGPVMSMLEARREKIAGEFKEADRLKAEAERCVEVHRGSSSSVSGRAAPPPRARARRAAA